MNSRDELIRRAMFYARGGYAVGGKPGESAMAQAEANRGVSSGNYGGQTARAEAGGSGGGNAVGNVGGMAGDSRLGAGGINQTTTRNEMKTSIFDPDKASARLGPNAAQAMAGAGVDPDRAIVAASNINRSGVPASGNLLQQRPQYMDRSLATVRGLNPQPTVPMQTPPASYNHRLNAQMTPNPVPLGIPMFGDFPSMGSYEQTSLDDVLAMSRALAAPKDVMEYGVPLATGQVRGLPGASRGPFRQHAGVDFAAATGTAVTPSMPGTVMQVSTASGYGPFVDVQDIYGNIQRYAVHKTGAVNVQPGQYVAPGDIIGTVGAQGVGINPETNKPYFEHLHFENITPKDRAYNAIVDKYAAGDFNTGFVSPKESAAYQPTAFAGSTKSPVGAPVQSSTSNWLESTGLSSYDPVSASVGMASALAPSIDPNTTAMMAGVGPQSIINSGYYNQASSFPEFDRLLSVPSYSAVGNSIMGDTVGSPYNNITQYSAPQSILSDAMAGGTGNPAPVQVQTAPPASVAQAASAPVVLPRPRPANLTQTAQAPVPLPVPRPANLTASIPLPRPRPASLTASIPLPVPRPANLTAAAPVLPRPRPANLVAAAPALPRPRPASLTEPAKIQNFTAAAEPGAPDKGQRDDRFKRVEVEDGDTIEDIAEKNDVSVEELTKANPGMTEDNIGRYKTVRVPRSSGKRKAKAGGGYMEAVNEAVRGKKNKKKTIYAPGSYFAGTDIGADGIANLVKRPVSAYNRMMPDLPAFAPGNVMSSAPVATPSAAISGFNSFSNNAVPAMTPPVQQPVATQNMLTGNNAVANAMRMIKTGEL